MSTIGVKKVGCLLPFGEGTDGLGVAFGPLGMLSS